MRSNKIKLHSHPTSTIAVGCESTSRWRLGAFMGAIAMLTSVVSMDAQALALGRITVQSALGEALRAEIDITEINASEAATLQATISSPAAFRAAGVEFMPVLNGVQINMQRRADGRSFLRLTGSRPVTEPFVDLILEANWSSGRVARDYTMLFDPPGLRSNSAAVQPLPTAPMIARPAVTTQAPLPSPAVGSTPRGQIAPAYSPPPPPVRPVAVVKPAAGRAAGNTRITVRSGDTAGTIASKTKTSSVSLDQMLVALLRGNPEAFIGGNVNRIKSGALLVIPTPEAAAAVSAAEATQTITAQSTDFNAFRRKLAAGVPTTTVASADRQASGKVQASVEDRAPANAVPDKLTLSKGAVAGKPATAVEEKIAAERQARESSTRVAELSKNISDLNKLGAASAAGNVAAANNKPAIALPGPSGMGTPAISVPVVISPQPVAPASTPAVIAQASPVIVPTVTAASGATTAAASAASSSNSPGATIAVASSSAAPIVAASAAPKVLIAGSSPTAAVTPAQPVVAVAASEPDLFAELLDNPLLLPGIALLIILLGGFAFYRYRQRKEPVQVDSSFLESRLQPDSFFGASGGQRVDTNETNITGSSLVYSPSQLDAAGDVDPVAEADVYLAYGRDLQAEEILKEAMRTSPTRVAIHAKLMEIYAKRRDTKAFAIVATEAFKLTRGEGPEWSYITEMGREMDPGNPMYKPGGQPQAKPSVNGVDTVAPATTNNGGFGSSTLQQAIEPQLAEPSGSVDFDLDLDFSMDEPSPAKTTTATAAPVVAPAGSVKSVAPAPMFDELVMDFGDSAASFTSPPATTQQAPSKHTPLTFENISFTNEDFNAGLPSGTAPAKTSTQDNSLVEFDMGDLSLDLDGPVTESAPHPSNVQLEDALETKFSLAEEFRSLGDPDGARVLAEEVLLEATGPLKVKTQAFLNALS